MLYLIIKILKKSLHACMQRVAFYSVIMYHGKQYIIFIVFLYNGQTGKQLWWDTLLFNTLILATRLNSHCVTVILKQQSSVYTAALLPGDSSNMGCSSSFIHLSGDSADAVPHYQKLHARVPHVWGNRRLQPGEVHCTGLHLGCPPSWSQTACVR